MAENDELSDIEPSPHAEIDDDISDGGSHPEPAFSVRPESSLSSSHRCLPPSPLSVSALIAAICICIEPAECVETPKQGRCKRNREDEV
ncbi:hypothetical protein L195_g057707 [Trifolium pratense]|uniref:Uncharacterized protein n=1 Tax=Trifolium pratense TaxID=57577 RepID=A0A2K3KWT0_TRIPR|nr:hypothetical protein L195_g057707 [Trifolium pratense]